MVTLLLVAIAIFIGLYMAWNIGANDVANSMSTAVGAKAITLRQAVIIASILNVVGAVLVGKHVTDTIKGKIIDISMVTENEAVLGFLAALMAASIFVTLATWKELPVSTTHAIIGGVTGFGLIGGGIDAVNWVTLRNVTAAWVLSPFAGAALAFVMVRLIRKVIFDVKDPIASAKKWSPLFIGLTIFIILMSIFSKTRAGELLGYNIYEYSIISVALASVVGLAGFYFTRRLTNNQKGGTYGAVEGLFRRLQVITSCYVAFSHGANDVANAMGPLAVILTLGWKEIDTVYLLALGGVGLTVGITTWGYKVIKTVGGKITALTNTRGFSVDFAATTVVLTASKFGLPVSTSHAVVGSVIGVGLARGLDAVDLSVIKKIVYSWLLTLPATAVGSILIYRGLVLLF